MKENKKTPSLSPYKGVRDFYPEEQMIQQYIFDTMREVSESFGYEEYHASVLEPSSLYSSKTSDEIVNEQTYTFTDRGGRDVTLRPEMTPTVARMVAAKRKILPLPVRWFSIPNLFRYERPQRGRLREHWQLNVDIFGEESLWAEVEVLALAYNIMIAFGLEEKDFTIRINDRRLLVELYQEGLGLKEDKYRELLRLVDAEDKMSPEKFANAIVETIPNQADLYFEKFGTKDKKTNSAQATATYKEINELINTLKKIGINNAVFDPSITRGFDYYTGTIFEVYDNSDENNRALFGGGRYDRLLEIFDQEKIPAVGFGMGDVAMRDVLETYGLLPELADKVDLYIAPLSSENILFSQKLAQDLRRTGAKVITELKPGKPNKLIEKADRTGAKYIILIGEDEEKSDTFKLRLLSDHSENTISRTDLLQKFPIQLQ